MKKYLLIALVIATKISFAQETVSPASGVLQTKWVKEENYKMKWYRVKHDTMYYEVGIMNTSVSIKRKKLFIVQNISMQNMTAPWVDSTVADAATIAPIYHSSSNAQRHMVLNFGEKIVEGFSDNHATQKMELIKDTVQEKYFDSNIYTSLVSWLPLEEGYTAKIPIYDYNNEKRHGIVYVNILSVKRGQYTTPEKTTEDVFIVDLTDGINAASNIYYISIKTRQVLKISSLFGPNKFEIIRVP